MKTKLLLCYILFICLNACAQKPAPDNSIPKMQWLAGAWQGTYNDKPFYEAWKKKNDSILVNFTIEINNNDTIVKEHGAMIYNGKGVVYFGGSGQWKLADVTDTSIVLSNDTLKFANKITWTHSKNDHWLTVIENPKSVIRYDLVRVDWLDKYVDRFLNKR